MRLVYTGNFFHKAPTLPSERRNLPAYRYNQVLGDEIPA